MKIQSSRRTTVLIVMFAILVVAVMAVAALRVRVSTATSQNNRPIVQNLIVENRTSAFQVVTAVRDGDLVRLSLRNGYSQPIDAFTLSSGANSGVQVDFTNSDTSIVPGAVYDYTVAAASLEPSGSSTKPLKLTILNVVFEDGAADGDTQATLDIKNRRRGEKIALSRILPLLDQALDSSELETHEGVQRLRNQISLVCDALEKEQPPEILGGILHGKGYILGDIQQLEDQQRDSKSFRNGIVTIREHYKKKSAKLER
jgi:flagellar basal body-associated protein FliL